MAILALMLPPTFTQITPTEDALKGALGGAIEAIIIDELKDMEFAGTDNWGHKKKTPFGRMKNGFWTRYSAKPEDLRNKLDFKVKKIERRLADMAYIEMRLSIYVRGKARAQVWALGRLIGDVDAGARATVIVTVGLEVKLKGDLAKAEFTLEPKVTRSKVEIPQGEFVLDNLGRIGGMSAEIIGVALKNLGTKSLKKKSKKLADELEDALQATAKQADLRIKLRDFLSIAK